MIKSPILQEMRAEVWRKAILIVMKNRFGEVPNDVRRLLGEMKQEKKLEKLHDLATRCDSMETFKERLLA